MNTSAILHGLNPTPTNKNGERTMTMSKTYTYEHPTGSIIFQSWDHYNRFLVYESKVTKRQIKSNKNKSQSKEEPSEPAETKVKVNNMDEFIKTWDVLYPKK